MRIPQVVATSVVDKMELSGRRFVSMYMLFLRTRIVRCCCELRRMFASLASNTFLEMIVGDEGSDVRIRTSFVRVWRVTTVGWLLESSGEERSTTKQGIICPESVSSADFKALSST